MRKLMSVVLVAVFTLGFVVGLMSTPAKAGPPCIAYCVNGQLKVCCPFNNCRIVGPCIGD